MLLAHRQSLVGCHLSCCSQLHSFKQRTCETNTSQLILLAFLFRCLLSSGELYPVNDLKISVSSDDLQMLMTPSARQNAFNVLMQSQTHAEAQATSEDRLPNQEG